MKKCIIYSITIYILLTMFILLQKPNILYDIDGEIKSWNYLKSKIRYGFYTMDELICLPTVMFMVSVFSFIIAINVINE